MSIGYINGSFVDLNELVIPIDERGHNFGDGVYEVARVYNGKPFMLDEHLERLIASSIAIRLNVKDAQYYKDIIMEAIEKSGLKDCDVYLQITRGIATRKHLFPEAPVSVCMTVRPMKPIDDEIQHQGVKAIIHDDERWANCYIKSLNLLPNILAKQAAQDKDCYEAILIKDGFVTEGTSSNIYMVNKGAVYTHPLTKEILPGITRLVVKKLTEQLAVNFVEQKFTVQEMLTADEIFMTSTTNEVLPITNIDGQEIGNGRAGAISKKLFEAFKVLR